MHFFFSQCISWFSLGDMIMSWTRHSSQGGAVLWMVRFGSNSNPMVKGRDLTQKSEMGKHDGQVKLIVIIAHFRVFKKYADRLRTMATDLWDMKTHLQSCFGKYSGAKTSVNCQISQCQDVPRKWPFEMYQIQGKPGCSRRNGHCSSWSVVQWEKQRWDSSDQSHHSLSSSQVIGALLALSQEMQHLYTAIDIFHIFKLDE